MNGIVKWFDSAKGFGFIQRSDAEGDIFVHYKNIRGEGYRSLKEGQAVEFTLLKTEKGFQADDVTAPDVPALG